MAVTRICFMLISAMLAASWRSVDCLVTEDKSAIQDGFVKLIQKCMASEDVGLCLKWKAANALDRLTRMKGPLPVTDYVSLVRRPEAFNVSNEDGAKPETEENVRQQDLETGRTQNEKLNDFIWDKIIKLLSTRTIQISIPPTTFEGRGAMDKIFKKNGVFMMAGIVGGILTKLAIAKIVLLAGKALVIAKIALIVSLVVALRRILNRGNLNAEVFNSLEDDAGWQRRYEIDNRRSDYGSNMAYSYHKLRYNH